MSRALLYCAHPGHELRVYGWLREVRPTVCFLTDGSGADGVPRLARSTELIEDAGAQAGPMYGDASDRTIYAALAGGDLQFFRDLARRLAKLLVDGGYDLIAGDGAEGYNPSHDVARMIIDAAVDAAREQGTRVESYAFAVIGDPRHAPPGTSAATASVRLSDAVLDAKIECGRAYARDSGGILVSEVDAAIEQFGIGAFREERFFGAGSSSELESFFDLGKPFYETYGEQQVAAGKYAYVLRWTEHVRPVARALRQLAASA